MGLGHATYAIAKSPIANGDTLYRIEGFECVLKMNWVATPNC